MVEGTEKRNYLYNTIQEAIEAENAQGYMPWYEDEKSNLYHNDV
jgi:hypothetical protein